MSVPDTTFDAADPHHNVHHGHHVYSLRTLVFVLCGLLFFTVLTVAVSQGEQIAAHYFGLNLPDWVNVMGAMSIATVKAMLVCMYFMGLKHDNPLNAFVLLFTLIVLGLFMLFPSIDVQNRQHIYAFGHAEVTDGGTGYGLNDAKLEGTGPSPRLSPHVNTGGPLVEFRREQAIAEIAELNPGLPAADIEGAYWLHYYDEYFEQGRHPKDTANYFHTFGFDQDHGTHDDEQAIDRNEPKSDAEHSRPRTGVTANIFDPTASLTDARALYAHVIMPGHGEHGSGGHGDHHDADHSETHDEAHADESHGDESHTDESHGETSPTDEAESHDANTEPESTSESPAEGDH